MQDKVTEEEHLASEAQGCGSSATFLGNISTFYQPVNSQMFLQYRAEASWGLSAGKGGEEQNSGCTCRALQSDRGEEAGVPPGVGSAVCPVGSTQMG